MRSPFRSRSEAASPGIDAEEAYRILRANLSVAMTDLENPSVIITSARPGEGKTATSVSLARSMALTGKRVVLVDLDLRHPDAHRHIGAHNEFGVSEALRGTKPLEDCLQYVELQAPKGQERGLYVLAAGKPVPNPTELLGSRRTARILDLLAAQADAVIIDTPPILPVADTLVIGRIVAGAVLVVESRGTPIGAIEQAKSALIRSQTRLLGLVLNKFQPGDATMPTNYGYGYGYGYRSVEVPDDEEDEMEEPDDVELENGHEDDGR